MERISSDLAVVALERAGGADFERFFKDFFPAVSGANFVPLGGNKDGGADGYDLNLHGSSSSPTTFYQASIEQDAEKKIRKTIQRLREFERRPRRLIFVTSKVVRYVDVVCEKLSGEFDLTVDIRDQGYIVAHLNDDSGAIAAFNAHLRHYTDFLKGIGSSSIVSPSQHVRTPAVYVFLAQEMERRRGDYMLVDSMTDALILWALEGTDPDLKIFRNKEGILSRIVATLPAVKQLVEPRLQKRLTSMASKTYSDNGRAIKFHRQEDAYCLPFETRRVLENENAEDERLKIDVTRHFRDRAYSFELDGLGRVGKDEAVKVALRALQITFEREGLEFASFLRDGDAVTGYPTITDSIKAALADYSIFGNRGTLVGECAFSVLRGVLYDSTPIERDYLRKLSQTYTLLFTLNTEPRLVKYFQDMAGDFYLYVGTDVLIRALSEHFLAEPDQITRNTLLISSRLGAKLVLTGPVLEEVVGHLRACDMEYKNHVQAQEHHMDYEMIKGAPHIILRSYLYARRNESLGRRRPKNWESFIHLFCDYKDLHRVAAYDDLRRYLQQQFNLDFRAGSDLQELCDANEVEALAQSLSADKKDPRLAKNDALIALAVYGHRKRRREDYATSEFGFQTWWLTGETSILRYTRHLTEQGRKRYIMRPDFLLNFLTLAPRAAEIRHTYANIFPTLLGVTLARRMNSNTFHAIMEKVADAENMPEARRSAAIAKISNDLKSNFNRQYLLVEKDGGCTELETPPTDEYD